MQYIDVNFYDFLCEKIVRGWVVELFCLLKEEFFAG